MICLDLKHVADPHKIGRIKCPVPDCGGTICRETAQGRPGHERKLFSCALCDFSQLIEWPRDDPADCDTVRITLPRPRNASHQRRETAVAKRLGIRPGCEIAGCGGEGSRPVHGMRMCFAHYGRWHEAGRPDRETQREAFDEWLRRQAEIPIARKHATRGAVQCGVPGCVRGALRYQPMPMCEAHAARWRNAGKPLDPAGLSRWLAMQTDSPIRHRRILMRSCPRASS